MRELFCTLLSVWLILMFARIVLSFFPLSPTSPLASIFSFLYTVTEPVLGPLRRVVPPLGPIDITPMIVVFVVYAIQGAVCTG